MRGFIVLASAADPITPGMRVQVRTITAYWPRLSKTGTVTGSTLLMGGVTRDVTETVEEIDQLIRNQKP